MPTDSTPTSLGVQKRPAPMARTRAEIIYPDSDGKPIADNTRQFEIIAMLQGGLSFLFLDRPDVFVAGDLLWYPVEGNNKLRMAPDAMVAFGRPPGYRGSYKQWCEGGIAPQVVFEILSPGNRRTEMSKKFYFYQRHGVEEYYVHDPDRGLTEGWLRQAGRLVEIPRMEGWVSPRLGIRFGLEGTDLVLWRPDGRRFKTSVENEKRAEIEARRADEAEQQAETERQQAEAERQRAEIEARRADEAEQQAETERQQAEAERQRAEIEARRADEAEQQAKTERQRAEIEARRAREAERQAETEYQRAQRLAERLRALGLDPDD
ncbi:putative restriction endonuclease domain-containing protein [Gammaproteobacteria bacterium]